NCVLILNHVVGASSVQEGEAASDNRGNKARANRGLIVGDRGHVKRSVFWQQRGNGGCFRREHPYRWRSHFNLHDGDRVLVFRRRVNRNRKSDGTARFR